MSIVIVTGFIDTYVTDTHPTGWKLTQLDSGSTSILSTGASDELAIATAPCLDGNDHKKRNHNCRGALDTTVQLSVAKQISIKPRSMYKVLVVITEKAFSYFGLDEQLAQQEKIIFAKELMEVVPNSPFDILMAKLTSAKLHMPKHTVSGRSSDTLCTVKEREILLINWKWIMKRARIRSISLRPPQVKNLKKRERKITLILVTDVTARRPRWT